jgi:hypothetical protein
MTILKCLLRSLLTEKYHQALMKKLTKRKDIVLKDIYYAADILDPKINAQYLSREEQVQNTEFIDKVATINVGIEHSAK